ncbi:hypothetical protein PGTUg99_026363 [Puccinia graminis f. sp. tritici]|uniref:Uncharacterized protein n=1 Tax=Puccinia graminis f. sp. tritici TaxID=56615 RepID=A0A5B0SIZ2_PUCGR|nr:hypothetical protein PGTUg99_026363 [Puccinia graminis f. sp. tritici]
MASTNFSAIQLSTILDSSSAPQLFRLSTILKLIRLSTILALVRLYFPAVLQRFCTTISDLNQFFLVEYNRPRSTVNKSKDSLV